MYVGFLGIKPITCAYCHSSEEPLNYTSVNESTTAVQTVPHGPIYHKRCAENIVQRPYHCIKFLSLNTWVYDKEWLDTSRPSDKAKIWKLIEDKEQKYTWFSLYFLTLVTAVALATIPNIPLYTPLIGGGVAYVVCKKVAEKMLFFDYYIAEDLESACT